MDFVAIDVETANADMASICQIGIAGFSEGRLVEEWSSLVNPEDYFHFINIGIHGITEDDVAGSPTFPELAGELASLLNGRVCVSHTHFDRVSIRRAITKYNLASIDTTWLDSARVVRRAWEECAHGGYGLSKVCERIGYEFTHHDALEDAKACGHVLLAAMDSTGLNVSDWLQRVSQPINPSSGGKNIAREGNSEGDLFGEVMVFTGALEISRTEAANLAACIGCSVASNVTKKTSILVVGDQDVTKLAGKDKSSKHLKAEELIAKGQTIRIIRESDFKGLVMNGSL